MHRALPVVSLALLIAIVLIQHTHIASAMRARTHQKLPSLYASVVDSGRPRGTMRTRSVANNISVSHMTTSPLETINPWLSACDLAHPASAPDLQGTCTAQSLPIDEIMSSTWSSTWSEDEGPGPPPPHQQHKRLSSPPKCPSQCNNNLNNNDLDEANVKQTTIVYMNNKNNNKVNLISKNNNNNNTQCLYYIEDSHKERICESGREPRWRMRQLAALRLKHCCEHAVDESLSDRLLSDVLNGGHKCRQVLANLIDTDNLAARITCEFTEVLSRYDCTQAYSIVFHCDDCKEAYRRWVCSSLIPHFAQSAWTAPRTSLKLTAGRQRVRPCRTVCQTVEQKCPYMLPGDRAPAHPTQYAGEPTFLCLDAMIPETGKQEVKSSHGPSNCCYKYCAESNSICSTCNSTYLSTLTSKQQHDDNDVPSWRVHCDSQSPGTAPISKCSPPQAPEPHDASLEPPMASSARGSHACRSRRRRRADNYYYYSYYFSKCLQNDAFLVSVLITALVAYKLLWISTLTHRSSSSSKLIEEFLKLTINIVIIYISLLFLIGLSAQYDNIYNLITHYASHLINNCSLDSACATASPISRDAHAPLAHVKHDERNRTLHYFVNNGKCS